MPADSVSDPTRATPALPRKSMTLHGVYHPNGHCPNGQCAVLTVQARLDEATTYEMRGGSLLAEADVALQRARSHFQRASNLRAEVGRCHHCGKPDEADGDHTCPCPDRDDECKFHPKPDEEYANSGHEDVR